MGPAAVGAAAEASPAVPSAQVQSVMPGGHSHVGDVDSVEETLE